SATGLDIKTLDEQWSKNLKKIYWPEVTDRLEPTDFAKKLTDHKKEEGHYNLAPVFSPDGTKIALLTSRNDYADVYLISAIDGRMLKKLVSGSKTESLEELHWLSPGMDWSPDGTKIVFSSKSGNSDALQFVNTKNGKITQTDFKDTKLDGIFTTKWSFDGKEIGFIGNYKGASDVYVYNLETKKLENLTNDFFSDSEPAFSPDGKLIAFVSDRGENGIGNKEIYAEKMFQHDFYQKDLYIFNRETKQLKRLTKTKWVEDHPVFSPDGKFLAFTSEKNGISNIFLMDLEKESEPYPITNALTGCYQIDWSNDGNKMAFTSLFNGGWDIFVISNPKNIAPDSIKLKDTFYLNLQKEKVVTKKETTKKTVVDTTKAKESEITAQDFRSYVFAKGYSEKSEKEKEDDYKPVVVLSDSLIKNEQGDYNVNRYRLKFTPDYTGGAFGYDTFNGLQGQVAFSFSDIMGDHNFGVGIGFFVSLQNSNYVFSYAYLPKRTDWLGQAYHYADFYRIGLSTTKGAEEAIVRLRQIGLDVVGSYPISKFRRIDFGLDFRNQRRELISKLEGEVHQEDQHLVKRSTKVAIPNVSYVRDSTLPWYTGPVDGWRYSLNYLGSPKFSGNSMDFHTFTFDTRHYFRVTKQNSFAFRLSGGRSFGPNKQHFFLGGIKYWFNPGFDNVETDGKLDKLLSQEEEFFPYFITSIRGADYYQGIGKQFFVLNSEFRHILIKRFDMGFPPFSFPPVFGAIFMDSGAAWDGKFDLHRTSVKSEFGEPAGTRFFNDLIMTYGLSTSIPLGFLFFKIDVAWLYDGHKSHKPQWLFSLGTFGDEF
ncbi:PD40 domain-containing protein, partial [bacterium]|nr:PD40 domain-containing protein [bacterium]